MKPQAELLLPSRKARQVIAMHCPFMWVCMYVCISADCAMQFCACVCISTTFAQYNPMLTYVCPSRLCNYCTIQWPKCAQGRCLPSVLPFERSDSMVGLSKDSLPNSRTSRGCARCNCYSPRRVTCII